MFFNKHLLLLALFASTANAHECDGAPAYAYVGKDDCSGYYRCLPSPWSPQSFNCPGGTLWDVTINKCNHANQVSCGGSTPTPAPVTPAPVTPAPVTPAPVTPAPVTPSPTVTALCAGEPDNTYISAANPGVCSEQYYICRVPPHQTQGPLDCATGLLWDDIIGNCNYPSNIPGCEGYFPTPAPVTPAPVTPSPVTPAPTVTSLCAGLPDNTYIPATSGCSEQYYICRLSPHQTQGPLDCSEGLLWDDTLGSQGGCNYSSNINGCENYFPTPAPVTPAPVTPAPVTPAPVTPAPVPTCCTGLGDDTYFGIQSCGAFVRCVNGVPVDMGPCPEGTLFDTTCNCCNDPTIATIACVDPSPCD